MNIKRNIRNVDVYATKARLRNYDINLDIGSSKKNVTKIRAIYRSIVTNDIIQSVSKLIDWLYVIIFFSIINKKVPVNIMSKVLR